MKTEIEHLEEEWAGHHERFMVAQQNARLANHENIRAFKQYVAGTGSGPPEENINLALDLQREEDEARMARDGVIERLVQVLKGH